MTMIIMHEGDILKVGEGLFIEIQYFWKALDLGAGYGAGTGRHL